MLADEPTRLENCAAWHIEARDRADNEKDAERHDMIAFRLFRVAREMRALVT